MATTVNPWSPDFLDRVEDARQLLRIRGFLSSSENDKVRERIRKGFEKHGVSVSEGFGFYPRIKPEIEDENGEEEK